MSATSPDPPLLSIVLISRRGFAAVHPVLEAIEPQVEAVGAEVVVVDGTGETPAVPSWVRWVGVDEKDWIRLTHRGVLEARGDIVAICEDHVFPDPGWCAAILRAHAEHPEADMVAGCMANGCEASLVDRAYFLAFAAPYIAPLRAVPRERPPALPAVSFKRRLLAQLGGPGSLETFLIPHAFTDGRMVVDDRIRCKHEQHHSLLDALKFSYVVNRAAYGYSPDRPDPARRREVLHWLWRHQPAVCWHVIRATSRGTGASWVEQALAEVLGLVARWEASWEHCAARGARRSSSTDPRMPRRPRRRRGAVHSSSSSAGNASGSESKPRNRTRYAPA
jgi:hypothetical protein